MRCGVEGSPRIGNPVGMDRWCQPHGAECLQQSGWSPPPGPGQRLAGGEWVKWRTVQRGQRWQRTWLSAGPESATSRCALTMGC
jgi:hypothetical protein